MFDEPDVPFSTFESIVLALDEELTRRTLAGESLPTVAALIRVRGHRITATVAARAQLEQSVADLPDALAALATSDPPNDLRIIVIRNGDASTILLSDALPSLLRAAS